MGMGEALAQGNAKNGLYVANAAGCIGCHTDNKPGSTPYAGGRALDTPYGTFYGPNITPHPEAGIGRWAEADLVKAVRLGERRDGAHYYPAFPYPSFAKMTEATCAIYGLTCARCHPMPGSTNPMTCAFHSAGVS